MIDLKNILDSSIEITLPKYKGVYILYLNDQVVYVGVSHCIITRISQHRLTKGVNFFDSIKIIEVDEWWKAIVIEDYLIELYNPVLNKNKNCTNHKRYMLANRNGDDITKAKGPSCWLN